MKKFALTCIAFAAVSASAEGLAVGYDHALTGVEGISFKLDANQMTFQGIMGLNYTSKSDQNDYISLAGRFLFPMGQRDNLSLQGGFGITSINYSRTVNSNNSNVTLNAFGSSSDNNNTQFYFEIPFVAQYKVSKNFGISTQIGLSINPNDGFAFKTNGSLLGNAGFHVFF